MKIDIDPEESSLMPETLTETINGAPDGTPDASDKFPFIDIVPAISRVVRGTASDAGTIGSVVQVLDADDNVLAIATITDQDGGLADLTHFQQGEAASAFVGNCNAWLSIQGIALLGSFGGTSGDTWDITCAAGAEANGLQFETTDPNLSFEEITAGADEIQTLKKTGTNELVTADALLEVLNDAPVAEAIAGDEPFVMIQNDVTVSGAGTEEANSGEETPYEFRGFDLNGKRYFNKSGGDSDSAISSIAYDSGSSRWQIYNTHGDPLYRVNSVADFPPSSGWVADIGSSPAPTVSATPTLKTGNISELITIERAEANSEITPCADDTYALPTSITTKNGIITEIS